MNKRILIFSNNILGKILKEGLDCLLIDKNISSYSKFDRLIKKLKPSVVLSCYDVKGKNADVCEKNVDATLLANSFVPIMLFEAALKNSIRYVHISSGCLYHFNYKKDTPITEKVAPNFFELIYSRSKIYSERALELLSRRFPVLIVRMRVPLDSRSSEINLLEKLIAYGKVIDMPNSVSYIPDFVRALKHLIRIDARGIYNIVNKGALRYPDLMEVYRKYVPGFKYEIVNFKKLNLIRTNIILSTEKLQRSGFKVRNINGVLEECVKDYLGY